MLHGPSYRINKITFTSLQLNRENIMENNDNIEYTIYTISYTSRLDSMVDELIKYYFEMENIGLYNTPITKCKELRAEEILKATSRKIGKE